MTIQSVKVECYTGSDANIKGSGNEYQWSTNTTASPKAGGTVSVAGFQMVEGDSSSLSDDNDQTETGSAAVSKATGTGSNPNAQSKAKDSSGDNSSSAALTNIPVFSVATMLSVAFVTIAAGWGY